MTRPIRLLLILIAVIQAIDVIVHISTWQAEVLRLIANVVIAFGAVWAAVAISNWKLVLRGAALIYFVFNVIFLFQAGFTNANTGGFRWAFFVFVILTLLLAARLGQRLRQRDSHHD